MDKKINLLKPEALQEETAARTETKTGKPKAKRIIWFFIFIIFAFFAFGAIPGGKSSSWFYNLPIISQLKHLVESADSKLKGENENRINVLLLGIGGKHHEGGLLTDTIMLASLRPSAKKLSLLSIPRDLAVPVENMGWQKINGIHAAAEMKNPNSGGLAASQTISDIFQIPVDYYITVDFTGFEKIIDDLGGIEVNVENSFDDYKYPVLGNEDAPWEQRFEHLHIEKGAQTMDGGTALKYARSRHAYGVEGSDFARSKRQQKILEAVKNKIMSINILFKPNMISKIISHIGENYSSNLKMWEMAKLWSLAKDVKSENISARVLDNGPNGLLVDTIGLDGAYLLSPRSGDFSEIRYLISNIFEDAPAGDKEKVADDKASVEIRNGTWINGLASKTALDLEKYGFNITRVGNAGQRNAEKSIIYDLTYGKKIQALAILKNKTNAEAVLGIPQWLMDDLAREISEEKDPIQPDFILILGQDADATKSGAENIEQR